MDSKTYDVFGIGNTLMDVLIPVEDHHLLVHNLRKGLMHLVDDSKVHALIKAYLHLNPKMVPAGATTNTLMGISALGGKCVLCGRVGKGQYGNLYEEIITKRGVIPRLYRCEKSRTGKVVCLITPDAERTFGVHLGAAANMGKAEIPEEDIKRSKWLYFTGYEYESVRESVLHGIGVAGKGSTRIAMDLGDPDLVRRNRDAMLELVQRHVDLLFMNEKEAEALLERDPVSAAQAASRYADTVIVKLGVKGSLVVSGGAMVRVPAQKTTAIDTTGAGDLFAAGFLHSIINGKSPVEAGRMGAIIASKVVSQVGAMLEDKALSEIAALLTSPPSG